MSLRRAKTVDEYVERVRQAVFEVADLRECLGLELEDLSRFPAFLDPLDDDIKALFPSMRDGDFASGREDLPFMDVATRFAGEIPFQTLLEQINEAHRRGLGIDDDV